MRYTLSSFVVLLSAVTMFGCASEDEIEDRPLPVKVGSNIALTRTDRMTNYRSDTDQLLRLVEAELISHGMIIVTKAPCSEDGRVGVGSDENLVYQMEVTRSFGDALYPWNYVVLTLRLISVRDGISVVVAMSTQSGLNEKNAVKNAVHALH